MDSDFADVWRSAGVKRGDTLLLHSSAKRLLTRLSSTNREVRPDFVIRTLIDVLGPEGTLLLPTFNFAFASGGPFDIRKTPSEMGVISECARSFDGAVRTGHPIYSFAAIGKNATELRNVCNSSGYGTDSPFGRLLRWNGRIAILDLPDQHSMTFYHHVEECMQVDYRYHKSFEGPYTDRNGNCTTRTFSLFVRDLDRGVQTAVSGMESILWSENLFSGSRPGEGWGIRTIPARRLFDRVAEVIRNGQARGLLYSDQRK